MTHLKLQKSQIGDITQQHIDILGDLLVGNHLFVIFAVLDVSFAVNSCLNRSFLHDALIYKCVNYLINVTQQSDEQWNVVESI